ncbi:hypothetical protein [Sphingosinicella xenopeptidilytica]|uniref:RapA2 cadherin-like domain-containing protein n=1 Tax=Sphingosinicella xenopeptidilytica TaxID=364098 RepID=A0ABW3C3I6_SPHXN
MALNELTLSHTRGVRGRPFQAEIEGLTSGWVEVVSDKGAPGFAVINGRVRHEALPYQPSTVVLRERAPGQSPRLSRIEISASEPWEIEAQAASMIGEGRTLRRLLVTSVLDSGDLIWHVLAEDDLGDTEWEEVGEPTPSAPAFASEPGTLDEVTEDIDATSFGFVTASGYPPPTYLLSGTYPENVQIIVGGDLVTLPATVSSAQVPGISYIATGTGSGAIDVDLTASNGVSPDAAANATVPIDIAPPAPEWSPSSYNLELPFIDPITFGNALVVSNADTIKVIELPGEGVFYIDDGDDTPLAVNDEFPLADLADLTGESDGDTGPVTGDLVLQAIGDGGTANITITVTIADNVPVITSRTLNIEQGQTLPLGLDLSNYMSAGTGTLANDSDATLNYPDQSA